MHGWYFDFSKVPKPQNDSFSETQESVKAKTSSKTIVYSSSVIYENEQKNKNKDEINSIVKNKKIKSTMSDEMEDCDISYGREQDNLKKKKNDFLGKRRTFPGSIPINLSANGTNFHVNNSTNIQSSNTVLYNETERITNKEGIDVLTIILTTIKDPLAEIKQNHHLQYDTKLVSKVIISFNRKLNYKQTMLYI